MAYRQETAAAPGECGGRSSINVVAEDDGNDRDDGGQWPTPREPGAGSVHWQLSLPSEMAHENYLLWYDTVTDEEIACIQLQKFSVQQSSPNIGTTS